MRVSIGCAGWTLPRDVQAQFGPGESHLARYATRLNACEINSSFHRPHSRATYERWAASVPADFRFCAKLPKAITHERRLVACESLLDEFLAQVAGLGDRGQCLLVQLPPSLEYGETVARSFLHALRERWHGSLCMEPRHVTWFGAEPQILLAELGVARVLADPVRHEAGAFPGGSPALAYLRLHGTPRVYYSAYEPALIGALARRIAIAVRDGVDVWCIFDNTASGAAARNALELRLALEKELA